MLTDDPGTPGAGQWEINTALLEQATAAGHLLSAPHIDINYGWGEHIQLKYESGYLIENSSGAGGAKSGWDDSLLGLKWRFLDQEGAGMDVSTYPQLELQNSPGSVRRGIAERTPNLFLPIEVAYAHEPFTLVGEVGYQYLKGGDNERVVGVLGAFELSKKLELLAEVRSLSSRFLSGGDLIANIGLRRQLSARVRLLASAGTGLRRGPDTTRFVAYLGAQVLLGDKQ
jgi:hypothetical protein